tara:strand:+ start:33 stop:515 length:483 start_codon:yes stop_codon:yes gene_type:complete
MKITKGKLRQIIKEEITRTLSEQNLEPTWYTMPVYKEIEEKLKQQTMAAIESLIQTGEPEIVPWLHGGPLDKCGEACTPASIVSNNEADGLSAALVDFKHQHDPDNKLDIIRDFIDKARDRLRRTSDAVVRQTMKKNGYKFHPGVPGTKNQDTGHWAKSA